MAEEAVIASRELHHRGRVLPRGDERRRGRLRADRRRRRCSATSPRRRRVRPRRCCASAPTATRCSATWQAGLGRVSSWTSDANNWAQEWSSWDGFVDFFSGVVKDTLPAGDNAGAVQADVRDGQIRVTVDSAEAFPDGAVGDGDRRRAGRPVDRGRARAHRRRALRGRRRGAPVGHLRGERHRDRQRRRDRAVVEHAGEQQLPRRVRARRTGRGVHDQARRAARMAAPT